MGDVLTRPIRLPGNLDQRHQGRAPELKHPQVWSSCRPAELLSQISREAITFPMKVIPCADREVGERSITVTHNQSQSLMYSFLDSGCFISTVYVRNPRL